MPANTQPIFPKTPKIAFGLLTTANIAKNGTGAQVTVFTAGIDGARLDHLKVRALGTNVQTVLRIVINNGLDPTVATNNTLILEKTIAATTLIETAELLDNSFALDYPLPAGFRVNVAIGTAVAAGLQVTCIGGDY